jgi:hypothetical protein
MLRRTVISWLILTTLFGPALCCCFTRAGSLPSAPHSTPAPRSEGHSCCAAREHDRKPATPVPAIPSDCPCKRASQIDLTSEEKAASELERVLPRGTVDLVAEALVASPDSLLEPLRLVGHPEPPVGLSMSARLSLLQTLRC